MADVIAKMDSAIIIMHEHYLYNGGRAGLPNGSYFFGPKVSSIAISLGTELEKNQVTTNI